MDEVLLTTDLYPDSNTSINAWNPYTGTKLMSLKGPPAAPNSLSLLKYEGLLIAEEGKGKPFIHVWQVGQPIQSSKRIMCPVGQQKLGPMTMSPCGNYLVVAINEKINIWQPATNRVLKVINSAHYRSITVLKFNDDGTFLISGGADGIVSVWQTLTLFSNSKNDTSTSSNSSLSPKYSWANHSLPVSAIHVGIGGWKATIFTVSEDRFLKIYSLMSGAMLLSVAFPQPLSSIVVDKSEFAVFIGNSSGDIYHMNMSSPPRSLEHQITNDGDLANVMKRHEDRVTCLAICSRGTHLASGDKSGCLYIWNLRSKQVVRTILGAPGGSATKGPITNLCFWLNDIEILKGKNGVQPTIAFPAVPKLLQSNNEEKEKGLLSNSVTIWTRTEPDDMDFEDDDDNFDNHSASAQSFNSTVGGMNFGDADTEKNMLRSQLKECEEINRKLHAYCVENIFNEPLPKRKKHSSSTSK